MRGQMIWDGLILSSMKKAGEKLTKREVEAVVRAAEYAATMTAHAYAGGYPACTALYTAEIYPGHFRKFYDQEEAHWPGLNYGPIGDDPQPELTLEETRNARVLMLLLYAETRGCLD
jgi:hypothetical protein